MSNAVSVSDMLNARLDLRLPLSPSQRAVIDLLAADETITNREIARISGFSVMRVRAAITKLRYLGIIGSDAGDRRIRV